MTAASRWRPRAGLARIHRSSRPDHRVLLLDSRRDGLTGRTEGEIVDALSGAGMDVDLDAISDPRGLLRVLSRHPEVLDEYDAVVGIAPLRADWRRSRAALLRVLQRVSERMPALLVEHGTDRSVLTGPMPDSGTDADVHRLLVSGSTGTARQISRAIRGLLSGSGRQTAAPTLVAQLPGAASRLRADIGDAALGRLERIVEIARDQFGLSAAEVNLLRGDLVVTVASAGALPRALSASDSLCTLALQRAGITVLEDTWLDPDACRRPPASEPDAVRFYAGCPIRSSTGEPIGVLCLWDHAPQRLEEGELALLKDLALLAEGELIHA